MKSNVRLSVFISVEFFFICSPGEKGGVVIRDSLLAIRAVPHPAFALVLCVALRRAEAEAVSAE